MIYHVLLCFVALVFDPLANAGVAAEAKDLEIALLRQQLRVMERKPKQKPRLSKKELLRQVIERVVVEAEGRIRLALRTPFAYLKDLMDEIRSVNRREGR